MDNLERQMEDQREQIRRTLDRIEGSGRRGGALQRLQGSLFRFPGRAPARGDPEETREDAPQSLESPGPTRILPTRTKALRAPRRSGAGGAGCSEGEA